MTRTITRSYDHHEDAMAVVSDLENAGIATENISLISHRDEDRR